MCQRKNFKNRLRGIKGKEPNQGQDFSAPESEFHCILVVVKNDRSLNIVHFPSRETCMVRGPYANAYNYIQIPVCILLAPWQWGSHLDSHAYKLIIIQTDKN